MIPGKKYTTDDVISIAWRRRWLLVIPLALSTMGAIVYAYTAPVRWMSTATIQVVPQRVPESYVRPTVTMRIEDRLESIKQLILSRTKLETIIQEFDLYPSARRTGLMEDVVDRMRNSDISMRIVKGDAFQVSFISDEPRLAMRVTERLAGLFISENLRDRELLAESSSQFLESQLDNVRKRLQETETKLANYRRTYSGQLPDQVQTNLQAVTNLQLHINQVDESINRDRDQRLLVQRQLADLVETPTEAPPGDGDGSNLPAAQQLELARARLRQAELRFKPEHPDIIQMRRMVGELEQKAEQEALQQPLSPMGPARLSPAEVAKRNRLNELQTALAQLDKQIAGKQTEQSRLRAAAGAYQTRVEAAPTRESELTALLRDYNTLSQQYQVMLTRNYEAQMAANLERRQGGEQFKLLDPARIPERPLGPNRLRALGMGIAIGLAIGVGLIAFLEFQDRSLKTDDDVMLALALPVIAVIPMMTTREERRGARRRRLAFSAAGATALMCGAAVFVWKFVQWRDYLPW
jgi:protein tyrosine kinase modulator